MEHEKKLLNLAEKVAGEISHAKPQSQKTMVCLVNSEQFLSLECKRLREIAEWQDIGLKRYAGTKRGL